jgi:hypothetical protein
MPIGLSDNDCLVGEDCTSPSWLARYELGTPDMAGISHYECWGSGALCR